MPVLEYFWTRYYADGTSETQFDLTTGDENKWGSPDKQIVRIVIKPFDNNNVNLLMNKGIATLASNLPIHDISIPDGECYFFRRMMYENGDRMQCLTCGFTFEHTEIGKDACCPQCFTSNEWYCARCNEMKSKYIWTNRGEVNCPDCNIPYGLTKQVNIQRVTYTNEKIKFYGIHTTKFDLMIYSDGSTELKLNQ